MTTAFNCLLDLQLFRKNFLLLLLVMDLKKKNSNEEFKSNGVGYGLIDF